MIESMNSKPRDALLSLAGISKAFAGIQVLQNVSLDVQIGEVHALVGENGAGKSTLLKILSGIYQASYGEIWIKGERRVIGSPRAARTFGIALVHQELQQVPELDVAQNMFLGTQQTKFGLFTDRRFMRKKAQAILARLDADIDVTTPVRKLRVAQRQIVEIAKALLSKAAIIAMDEPTSSLTPYEFEKLIGVIQTLSAQGVAVIYVSHKLDEIFRVASRATILRDGKLVGCREIASTTETELVEMMVGRNLEPDNRQSHVKPDIILSVRNLSRSQIVRNIGFDLHAGEVLGIAGLVGAGRTELVRLLAGADRPTDGTITLKGQRMNFHSPKDAIAAGIALLPEDRKKEGIIPLRSVLSNVAMPRLGRLVTFGLLNMGAIRLQVERLTKIVGLRPPKIDIPIKYFSGGNQQKAIICRWLMAKVDVLIFDEPTRGIDVGAKNEIYHLIEQLASEGRSLIIVSSDLPEILRLSDRVLVIRRGEAAGLIDRCDLNETSVMRMAV